jgi:hypothetical protein
MKVVCDGLEVPLEAPLPKPIPRPSHVMDSDMSKTQPNTQLECPRRKTEQVNYPTYVTSGEYITDISREAIHAGREKRHSTEVHHIVPPAKATKPTARALK